MNANASEIQNANPDELQEIRVSVKVDLLFKASNELHTPEIEELMQKRAIRYLSDILGEREITDDYPVYLESYQVAKVDPTKDWDVTEKSLSERITDLEERFDLEKHDTAQQLDNLLGKIQYLERDSEMRDSQ